MYDVDKSLNREVTIVKNKFLLIGLSVILLSASVLGGCGKEEPASPEKEKTVSGGSADEADANSEPTKILGDFSAITYSGETVDQSILDGADVTMINVWTTFCGYCIDEMPVLQKLSEEYKEQGLQIIGIVSDVDEANNATVTDIVNTLGLTYPNLLSSEDLQKQILQYIQSVPATLFVDPEGNAIGELQVGARDEEGWREIIESILEIQ